MGFGGNALQREGITEDKPCGGEQPCEGNGRGERAWEQEARRLLTELTWSWGNREPRVALEQRSDMARSELEGGSERGLCFRVGRVSCGERDLAGDCCCWCLW